MGERTELRDSRLIVQEGRTGFRGRLTYQVVDTRPENWYDATPAWPNGALIGTPMWDPDNEDLPFPGSEFKIVQLRRITPEYVSTSITNMTRVTFEFSSGPDLEVTEIGRKVLWEQEIGSESVTKFFDLDGQPVPGGMSVQSPLIMVTGTIDGWNITEPMESQAKTVNAGPFRFYEPGEVLYMGASASILTGSDTGLFIGAGLSTVTMQFQVRIGGWDEFRQKKSAAGMPIPGSFDVFKRYEPSNFAELFIGLDPGVMSPP